jgi:SSS family solute:Na+ symporter
MVVDMPVTLVNGYQYREGSLLWIVNNINFQYFSILITLISAAVMIIVSYMTPEPNPVQIRSLTFATQTAEDKAKTRASWGAAELLASVVVLSFIIGAYLYFRG